MLQILLILAMLATPHKTSTLATDIAIAGENSGLVISHQDYYALLRYTEVVKDDGDCLNDYADTDWMQPGLGRIAQAYMDNEGLCTPYLSVEWLDGAENIPPGYLWWGEGDGTLICYHELDVCFRES